jgi:hypothetical protein
LLRFLVRSISLRALPLSCLDLRFSFLLFSSCVRRRPNELSLGCRVLFSAHAVIRVAPGFLGSINFRPQARRARPSSLEEPVVPPYLGLSVWNGAVVRGVPRRREACFASPATLNICASSRFHARPRIVWWFCPTSPPPSSFDSTRPKARLGSRFDFAHRLFLVRFFDSTITAGFLLVWFFGGTARIIIGSAWFRSGFLNHSSAQQLVWRLSSFTAPLVWFRLGFLISRSAPAGIGSWFVFCVHPAGSSSLKACCLIACRDFVEWTRVDLGI